MIWKEFERAMGLTEVSEAKVQAQISSLFQCPLSGLWDLRFQALELCTVTLRVSMPFERAMGLTGGSL